MRATCWRCILLTAALSACSEPSAGSDGGVTPPGEQPEDAGDEQPGDGDADGPDDLDASPGDGDGDGEPDAGDGAGDIPPTHTLNVTASKERHSHTFLPKDADPSVSDDTFSGANTQTAEVDPRAATMVGKLIVNLGGAGGRGSSPGDVSAFGVARGFHALAVAYMADYNIVIGDADYYGDARLEAFDGIDRTSMYAERDQNPSERLGLSPPDGVFQRVTMGLRYLDGEYPDEDWGYFLDADGNVRWNDVVFSGVSHGASSAARYAMVVRAGRVLSFSGPRDNSCGDLACSDQNAVIASWFSETPKTPIDRFYALTGGQDDQHTQHLVAFERLGYLGEPVDIEAEGPPYDDSHRLVAPSGVHSAFCGNPAYDDVCNYMLGVPPENQAGVD